jgi:hypothetical protein
MKKRILLVTAFCIGTFSILPSCDLLEECGTCELVTIDADGNTTSGTPLPYCGDALADKKNSSPQTIGGVTTYWDCY